MTDSDPRDYRSLGDLLRDSREERKLSLEQVNESTRISVRVLRALEQDDLEGASGAIYARGFVRTLARFYDLDAEWLDAKLDQLAGETSRPVLPVDDDGEVIAAPLSDAVEEERPVETGPKWEVESTRVRKVGASTGRRLPRSTVLYALLAVLVIAIALVWWLGRSGQGPDQGARAPAPQTTRLSAVEAVPDSVVTGSVDEEDAGTSPAFVVEEQATGPAPLGSVLDRAGPDQSVRPASSPLPSVDREEAPEEDAATASAGPSVRETETAAAEPEPAVQSGIEDEVAPPVADDVPDDSLHDDFVDRSRPRDTTAEPEEDPAAETGLPSIVRSPAEAGLAPMELVVRATGPVEVTISVDGAPAQTRGLVAGEAWKLDGNDHFSVSASAPSEVSFELDGRPRRVPPGWSGDEWMLFRPRTDGDD